MSEVSIKMNFICENEDLMHLDFANKFPNNVKHLAILKLQSISFLGRLNRLTQSEELGCKIQFDFRNFATTRNFSSRVQCLRSSMQQVASYSKWRRRCSWSIRSC